MLDVSLSLRDSIDGRRPAGDAERAGFSGAWISEVAHDPFLAIGVCATATERIALGTSVAIALARSPMTVALQAHDLQGLTGGRFRLGLGTQVRAHITRRFSMPWSRPVERMAEFVAALRAIWTSWEYGEPLSFEGEFYRHTLMTPAFTPPPHGYPRSPILLSGVGPRMTEMAGQVADGFIVHALNTPAYLREVTVPALSRGRRTADPAGFELVIVQMVATGVSEESRAAALEAIRGQVAFYASTPAYRGLLVHHDRGELADRLRELAHCGRWQEMPALVDDELLRAIAVVAPPEEVAQEVRRRHDRIADRVILYAPGGLEDDVLGQIAVAHAP